VSFVKSIFNFLRFNKKNWKAVVLCMVAATVFWFFNALNKSYTANISFPVVFEYDQERYTSLQTLPGVVRMNVSGTGWELFRRSTGFKVPPLAIPLERPSEVKKIVGTTLPALFASQLEKLQINFVITDTLRVNFDEKISRKFTVSLDSAQHYIHPDYGIISAVTLQPDTVWLEGPKQFIKSLPSTLPLTLPQQNIRKNYTETITLPYNNIVQTPAAIQVSFSVAEFITIRDSISLTIVNKPARLKLSLAQRIACTYQLPAANAQATPSLAATLDLGDLPHGKHKLVPHITGLPQHARLIQADSVLVNF
jgi:hypothetical protein